MLLGAGASVFAGIPTTAGLVEELRKRVKPINDQHERSMARFFASNILEETDLKDVEDLYDSVDRMLEAEAMHRFVTKCKTKGQTGVKRRIETVRTHQNMPEEELVDPPIDEIVDIDNTIAALKSIKSAIRDILLEKCMVDPGRRDDVKTVYDNVLKSLGIRDVLTTNYDNVIETYCEEARISLANGFERSFHGNRREWTGKFENMERGALRLVKMHGSVTWQRDGDAVLELGRPGARGEEHDVMIYPEKGLKRYDENIFPELERRFGEVLANTDLLVVIGYSFRDEGINRMIKQRLAAKGQKGKMTLLYVDPNPNSGMSGLFGREISHHRPFSTPPLWTYSTKRMPNVYAYAMRFDPERSPRVKTVVDTMPDISQ